MTEKDKIVSEERQVKPLGLNYYTAIKDNSVSVLDLSHARVIPEFMRVIYKMKHKFGHTNIILDFSSVNMVLPGPLVSISACIEFFKTQGLSFEIRVHNSYLLGTSFYSPEIPVENPTNSFLDKVWKFSESKHVYKIVDGLIDSLRKNAVCENGVLQSFEWGINEIMDNVINHSEAGCGYVMAQIKKKRQVLNVCIVDTGVGLLQTLKNTPPKPRNDINAISLSVQQGVKGMRSKGQGNGMWGMYKIVQENSGHLTIISGRGGIYFKDNATNNFKDIVFLSKKNKGTFISFNLNLNKETLLTNAIPGFTFPNLYIENLENETGGIVYSVCKFEGGTGTRESGEHMRTEVVNINKMARKRIIIDFENVGLLSSSFADEFIGKLITEFGFFQYQLAFQLINLNDVNQGILQRSVGQRLAEAFK